MGHSVYDGFLAGVYDYSPYFGKERENLVQYYREALNPGRPRVLELGTATGLMTLPLARAGFHVDTVDYTADMHKIARNKISGRDAGLKEKINFILADVLDYRPEQTYNAVIMPDSFLFVFLKESEQKKVLTLCHDALDDNGVLLFDFFKPADRIIKKENHREITRFRTGDTRTYILDARHEARPKTQTYTCHFTYQPWPAHTEPDERIQISVSYRYRSPSEITAMLADAGFNTINVVELFDGCHYMASAQK